jgi:hypothetical protein
MGLATAWRGAKSARRKRLAPWRSTTTLLHPTSRSSSMLDVTLPLALPASAAFFLLLLPGLASRLACVRFILHWWSGEGEGERSTAGID